MKIISVRHFNDQAITTFIRFPLSILLTVVITAISLFLLNTSENIDYYSELLNWTRSLYLSFLLSISATLLGESRDFSTRQKMLVFSACLVFALVYKMSIKWSGHQAETIRYVLLAVTFHVLVAISFINKNTSTTATWRFNKTMFQRILLGALYSAVLYLGLSLAFMGINHLLGVSMPFKLYANLWLVISGIFSTWFFLAGVPLSINNRNDEDVISSFPRGLKIFTTNILLPLVAIYMLILYMYAIKLIVQGGWHENWISYMVLIFAFFGILSFLLLHPLGSLIQYNWIVKLSKLFYALLIPLAFLMLAAALKRITQFGFTELRYLILFLSLWLIFISIYSLLRIKKNIFAIPVSLCAIGLFAAAGPWGMVNVSRVSQQKRFESQLNQFGLLVNGKVPINLKHNHSLLDLSAIDAQIVYLAGNGGIDALQPFFEKALSDTLTSDFGKDQIGLSASQILQDAYVAPEGAAEEDHSNRVSVDSSLSANGNTSEIESELLAENYTKQFRLVENTLLPIEDYQFTGEFTVDDNPLEWQSFFINGDTLKFRFKNDGNYFHFKFRNYVMLSIDPTSQFEKIMTQPLLINDPNMLSFKSENKSWAVKVVCTSITLARYNKIEASQIKGKMMVKIKK